MIVLTEKERIMKIKILIALSLIALIVGYSCQEDLEVVDPMSQDVGKGRLSVSQLDAESAKSLYEIMNNIVELPSWAEKEECNDSDCKQHAHSKVEIHSDSCKNDSCIHNLYGRMHNDSSNKQMRYKARSDLPELKKSNICLEWDNAREWSDNKAKYVEIPLNVGGKLYALKKWKQKNEKKTQNERSKVECMFVFEQKHGTEQVNSYIVTLIGTKEYLKKNKEKVKGLRHKPNDGKFTGYVYKSDLNGHIKQGYGYTDGKITHKIFSGHVFRNKEVPENVTYLQMGLFDMAVNASSYSLGWEYYCPVCGNEHEMDDDGQCDYIIEYCRNCNQPVDECECCYSCGQHPCECCYNCGDYPCRCCYNCNQYPCQCCYVCGDYPCQCCKICKDYPCTCNDSKDCPNCGYDPCICCGVCHEYPCSCTPVAPPQDCPGLKCPNCNNIIGGTAQTRSVCGVCGCGWWKEGHNKILDESLNLSSEQMKILKEASKYVDKEFQATKYSYTHAMRAPGQTKLEALGEMKIFFKEKVDKFKSSNDYFALGEAFHCIMDAYSPVHRFHEWDQNYAAYYVPHIAEYSRVFPEDVDNASEAITMLFNELVKGEESSVVYEKWVESYIAKYPDVFN